MNQPRKLLHFDCAAGAAGDMLAAALLDLMPDPGAAVARLNAIGIPAVAFSTETTTRRGIAARRLHVAIGGAEEGHADDHHHHHHDGRHHSHRTLAEVLAIVDGLALPPEVAAHVRAVFTLLAEAEARVHGGASDGVHFHEVGAIDAVADISAVSLLISELAPDEITASPVNVGGGTVHCAHGVLPVPAPCTAALLQGVAAYGGTPEDGELCTPTGAALLRHYATRFAPLPAMTVSATGVGAGAKDPPARANILRAFRGEAHPAASPRPVTPPRPVCEVLQTPHPQQVCQFRCAIDDMTAEDLAFAASQILEAGALDVLMLPALMKKGRPGTVLEVLCRPEARDAIAECIFRNTTTIGLREEIVARRALERRAETVETPLGAVRVKISEGYGVTRAKPEFEDLARIAGGKS